jgi:hypothetical protein
MSVEPPRALQLDFVGAACAFNTGQELHAAPDEIHGFGLTVGKQVVRVSRVNQCRPTRRTERHASSASTYVGSASVPRINSSHTNSTHFGTFSKRTSDSPLDTRCCSVFVALSPGGVCATSMNGWQMLKPTVSVLRTGTVLRTGRHQPATTREASKSGSPQLRFADVLERHVRR